MKNLTQYIKEAYDKFSVNDLKVVFDILPEIYTLTAPETYSESDLQIYLGDVILSKLPSEDEKYQKLFGKNINNINDAYFEYDKFEHSSDDYEDEQINLKWDKHYDENKKDVKLNMFKLTKLKYIILFDSFELLDNSDDVDKTLNEIFSKMDSSDINDYPVTIKYNPDELEYSK